MCQTFLYAKAPCLCFGGRALFCCYDRLSLLQLNLAVQMGLIGGLHFLLRPLHLLGGGSGSRSRLGGHDLLGTIGTNRYSSGQICKELSIIDRLGRLGFLSLGSRTSAAPIPLGTRPSVSAGFTKAFTTISAAAPAFAAPLLSALTAFFGRLRLSPEKQLRGSPGAHRDSWAPAWCSCQYAQRYWQAF